MPRDLGHSVHLQSNYGRLILAKYSNLNISTINLTRDKVIHDQLVIRLQ